MKRTTRQTGFSILEMLVVLTVISLLALVAVPHLTGRSTQAREGVLRDTLLTMRKAILMYRHDTGTYPPNLQRLLTNSPAASGWAGPYLSENALPNDPFRTASTGNNANWNYNRTTGAISSRVARYSTW